MVKFPLLSAVLHHPFGTNQNWKWTWLDSKLKKEEIDWSHYWKSIMVVKWATSDTPKMTTTSDQGTKCQRQSRIVCSLFFPLAHSATFPWRSRMLDRLWEGQMGKKRWGSCAPDVANWRLQREYEKALCLFFICVTLTVWGHMLCIMTEVLAVMDPPPQSPHEHNLK